MSLKVKITEYANPAAVGWRWPGDNGAEYEITWIRDAKDLFFSIKPSSGPREGKWSPPMPMHEKWNHDGTLKGARVMAHKFVTEGQED